MNATMVACKPPVPTVALLQTQAPNKGLHNLMLVDFVFCTQFHAGWLTGGDLVKTFLKIWIKSDKQSCRRMQCLRLFLMRLMWGSKGKVWKYLSKRVMVTVYSRIFISLSLNWKIHDKYINNHFSLIITYSAKLLLLKLFLACFHCFSVERFLVVTMILLLPENPSTAESSIKTTVAVVSVKFSLGVA